MELQKGHGTIKKLRTGAVISTLAISALGVSTGVSASEVEVAVNEPATRVVAKDEVVPKVPSQADVDKAKDESDKASQNVAKQKEVVATTEAKITDAEKAISDTTKKVEEASSVTPEKVAEAKADADKKASELATSEKTVADADKSVSATAEKVADQTKVVSNAEKTATATANKVADAQKKVDSLSSTTDTTQLEKEVAKLTNKVAEDTKAVSTAQTKLDNGKKAQSNKDQAIKDAQAGVSSAETKLGQATTALANAKADQSNKDKAVTSAKADLERAKEELASVDGGQAKLNISSEYVRLLREYSNTKNMSFSDQLKALGKKELENWGILGAEGNPNKYKAPEKDKNVRVDIKNLTPEVEREINLFTADLINQIRDAFGRPRAIVTEDSMRIAREVAKASKEEENHDFEAMDKVGNANGVLISENLGFRDKGVSNLAELKESIYENILIGLFLDSDSEERLNWAHALSFARLSDINKPDLVYQNYIGVGFQPTSEGNFNIHIDGTSDNGISENAKFNKTKVVEANNNTKALQEKLSLAQSTYDDVVKASQEAKTAVQSAQTAYTNAETALANARTHLSDLLGNKIDVPVLEKALADAKDKLAQDTKALQTAKESLALAKSNATDKAKALAEAKTALATAKAEQSNANQSLETAKGELEVLTKAHDVAVLARKSAGQDLARKREASKEATDTHTVLELALTKRDEVLKALDKELTDAKSKLGVLRAELKTAKDELARLEGIAEAKARVHANFKQLKADHDAYLAEQQRLQALKEKEDAIRKAGGEVKPVLDADGKVVDVVDAKAQNKPVNVATVGTKDDKTYQAPAKATNTKAEPKKQLPNTGTKDSGLLALLGASLGLLALAGKRKYNR
ncbi:SEC10/PgrA surface exclusion domain-containing protein [Streptococcus mitis]|uniref:SEC10/PgrA surface exclusion domain-containing protein n=1 Tax=Streptococcus mitis TaxID=28037 RepID=A0A4U1L6Y1_STRMT|nr:SEC10/PgrA surface exclusion domain-containing protein [Streptococcus mitis]TKD52692.1 SEC10/PgrA surface exclusion domain-containing protein [Streptococcus mitis]